jgi:B9 domain-containing protein 1
VTGQVEFAEVRPTRATTRRAPVPPRPSRPFSKCHPERSDARAPDDAFPVPDASPSPFLPVASQIPGCDNAYCKYAIVHGDDWTHLDGPEDGISQITRKNSGGPDQPLVWNFPVEVTYKSTNAFGWPQLILTVYEIDSLGRDVIRGYGCVHLPIVAGQHARKVPLYKPLSASLAQQFASWATGRPAEFSNPKFPAMGEGREVTRVQSTGYASVALNVMTKDMATFGYSEPKAAARVGA